MSTTIHKYVLSCDREQDIMMLEGAEILTAQVQHGNICIWTSVNPWAALHCPRRIVVLATDESAELSSLIYISTVQLNGGSLVFHVFESRQQF